MHWIWPVLLLSAMARAEEDSGEYVQEDLSSGVPPLVASVQFSSLVDGRCNCQDPTVCMAGSFQCRATCLCVPQALCGAEPTRAAKSTFGPRTEELPPLSRHHVPRSTLVIPREEAGPAPEQIAAGFGAAPLSLGQSQRYLEAVRQRARAARASQEAIRRAQADFYRAFEKRTPAFERQPAGPLTPPNSRRGVQQHFTFVRTASRPLVITQQRRTFPPQQTRQPYYPRPQPQHNHLGVYQEFGSSHPQFGPRRPRSRHSANFDFFHENVVLPTPADAAVKQSAYPPGIPNQHTYSGDPFLSPSSNGIGKGGWIERFRSCESCEVSREPNSQCCQNGCCKK